MGNDVSNLFCFRMMLQKEKLQREDAERQRMELEERLRRYEEEMQNAQRGDFLMFTFALPPISLFEQMQCIRNVVITMFIAVM